MLDKDGDGQIDASGGAVGSALSLLDQDGDGKVSYSELMGIASMGFAAG